MKLGKLIGVGNTASVYEWEDNKVLKLFYQGYPSEAVEREYKNAIAIKDMDFAKPRAYEIITFEEKKGIIYDRVTGESLLDRVLRTGNVKECATLMAQLHKEIIHNQIRNVPNYKEFLRYHVPNSMLTSDQQNEIFQIIDKLPEGNELCHGDFHPGNIIISGEQAYIIDFMNICYGDYLYDIARTVFLVEYTPVPSDVQDHDMILGFKKSLADMYLLQMNVTREMIKDYLTVIIAIRKGECPDEF